MPRFRPDLHYRTYPDGSADWTPHGLAELRDAGLWSGAIADDPPTVESLTRQQHVVSTARPATRTETTVTSIAEASRIERERVSAILSLPEANGRKADAEHLALRTSISVDDARALLGNQGSKSRSGTAGTTAGSPTIDLADIYARRRAAAAQPTEAAADSGSASTINASDIYARRRAATAT